MNPEYHLIYQWRLECPEMKEAQDDRAGKPAKAALLTLMRVSMVIGKTT